MKLAAPDKAPQLQMTDIQGNVITLGAGPRRKLICFFRDAACPFCNFHLYLLTHRHADLARKGLDIVVLFNSTPEEVKRFAARNPRPFPVIADPESIAYGAYHVEHSFIAKLKAIVTRMPALLKGLRLVGLTGLNTNNVVPADFLVDEQGNIVEAHYGRDAGDHIPFQRVEAFANEGAILNPARHAA